MAQDLRRGREGIRRWRSKTGWTQAQLGAAIGVDGSTVRHFENGRRGLPLERRLRLHDITGVRVAELMTAEERSLVQTAAAALGA